HGFAEEKRHFHRRELLAGQRERTSSELGHVPIHLEPDCAAENHLAAVLLAVENVDRVKESAHCPNPLLVLADGGIHRPRADVLEGFPFPLAAIDDLLDGT